MNENEQGPAETTPSLPQLSVTSFYTHSNPLLKQLNTQAAALLVIVYRTMEAVAHYKVSAEASDIHIPQVCYKA